MTAHTRKTFVSLYDELGLAPEVSPVEIRERFLWLVKATHPDLGGELADLDRYKRVLAAHYVLRDYWRRRRYDEYLENQSEFNPFLSQTDHLSSADASSETSSASSPDAKSPRQETGYRFFFGRKHRSHEPTNGGTSPPEAEPTTRAGRESSHPQEEAAAEPFRNPPQGDASPYDEPTRDSSSEYELEPEFASNSQQSQPSSANWSGPRPSSYRRRGSQSIPWLAIGAQIFAIVFGALCAGVIAHFVLLWLRPESGGLRGIFGS